MAEVLNGLNQVAEVPTDGPSKANDATAKNVPGMMIRRSGVVYRYVQFSTGTHTVAAADYSVVYWKSLNPAAGTFQVTTDESDTIAGINGVAGVLGDIGTLTTLYYTWIAVAGVVKALVPVATVAGDKLIGYTTDKQFNRIAASSNVTDVVFAVAVAAYATAGSNVLLMNLDW